MHKSALLVALLTSTIAFSAHAGDAEAGRAKSTTCAACHGTDGNSPNPLWPNIAGQHESYIIASLQAYKDGVRNDPLMTGMAAGLSEQDMMDLAAFYAGQERQALEADPELVELGERIYRGGNMESGVTACIACHGAQGRGNPAAGWPVIAGQHATYTAEELREYRAGNRVTDMNSMMRDIAGRMTDEEIEAVASYIQGLR
jgi:cytochrome c553